MHSTPLPTFLLIDIVMVFSSSLIYVLLASFVSIGTSRSLVSIWNSPLVYLFYVLIVFVCGIIPDSDVFLVIYFLIFNCILIYFTMKIWWVAILLISNAFLFFGFLFYFLIFCNIIIFLIAVKLCFLILWFTVCFVHDWNSWVPLKNRVSLGHIWMFPLHRKFIHPLYYLLKNC